VAEKEKRTSAAITKLCDVSNRMFNWVVTQQHSHFAMGWLSKWNRGKNERLETIRDDANSCWQL